MFVGIFVGTGFYLLMSVYVVLVHAGSNVQPSASNLHLVLKLLRWIDGGNVDDDE